ncbi:MAG: DNA polymerase III subunit gamma/tau [Opitutales bacterium]|jgi:DNA polymerase III subunit gamma/tau
MAEQGYQVIARRWRPKQFDELVGQDHVTRALGNAIEMGRIGHAYLFVGPRGTGKTTSARLFAKSLNWEEGPSLQTSEDSEIGKAIMEGRCLDVIEIDAASNNGVEQVRELRDECQYAPAQCRFKIYVIDEVHMLSQAAFNALLKTLEEPPAHVKFVFATTESRKVLPTITSRCQRFEFRPIGSAQIAEKLDEICKSEGIDAESEALASIARLANGGMRDAQSILDQMISFCGKKVVLADVLEVYGLASPEQIQNLAAGIASADYEQLLQGCDELAGAGLDLHRALIDLQDVARDSLIASIRSGGEGEGLGTSLSSEAHARILDALRDGEERVQRGLSDKVNFEATLLKAAEVGRSRAIDGLIREIGALATTAAGKKKIAESPVLEEPSPPLEAVEEKSADNEEPSQDAVEPATLVGTEPSEESVPLELTDPVELDDPQSVDQERVELNDGIEGIPASTRKILQDDFHATFLGVEKIDEGKLI